MLITNNTLKRVKAAGVEAVRLIAGEGSKPLESRSPTGEQSGHLVWGKQSGGTHVWGSPSWPNAEVYNFASVRSGGMVFILFGSRKQGCV